MGFEEDCFRESVDDMIDLALESKDPWMEGIGRERLEEGPVRLKFEASGGGRSASGDDGTELRSVGQPRAAVPTPTAAVPKPTIPFLPFAEGGFRTASGKAELYSEELKIQGLDPVADFTPPAESRHGKNDANLPLELLARKADNFLNSTFSNVPAVQEMEERDCWKFPPPMPRSAISRQATGSACSMAVAKYRSRRESTAKFSRESFRRRWLGRRWRPASKALTA